MFLKDAPTSVWNVHGEGEGLRPGGSNGRHMRTEKSKFMVWPLTPGVK